VTDLAGVGSACEEGSERLRAGQRAVESLQPVSTSMPAMVELSGVKREFNGRRQAEGCTCSVLLAYARRTEGVTNGD
jgi:hypothetical protein